MIFQKNNNDISKLNKEVINETEKLFKKKKKKKIKKKKKKKISNYQKY